MLAGPAPSEPVGDPPLPLPGVLCFALVAGLLGLSGCHPDPLALRVDSLWVSLPMAVFLQGLLSCWVEGHLIPG